MNIGYYHLYADGKTIKEISWEQWQKMVKADYDATNTRLLCEVCETEIYLQKGKEFMCIPRRQLAEILDDNWLRC